MPQNSSPKSFDYLKLSSCYINIALAFFIIEFMLYDAAYISYMMELDQSKLLSHICYSDYRKLLSYENYSLILQMSCANNYLYTLLKIISI